MERIFRSKEPFRLAGSGEWSRTAVLLIHGFTGSPSELRRLGYYLQDQGLTVEAILLPGHGTTPEHMMQTGWSDWWHHVLESYERLASDFAQIVVIGHSMGGLLALKLALERPVAGVIALAAPIYLTSKKTVFAILLQYVVSFVEKKPKPAAEWLEEAYSYAKTPVRCIVSLRKLMRLVKCSLPRITAPVFIAQGEKDGTVQPGSADYIFRHIGSEHKWLRYYSRSSHMLMLDADREQLYTDIYGFICALQGKTVE